MKKNGFVCLGLLLICSGSAYSSANENPAAVYSGGSAKADITPPQGTPLSGYGKLRGKPTRGIHDPIYARAAALSNGSKAFLFLSLDLCLIDKTLRSAVLEKIRTRFDLDPSALVLTATHTHSGSGAIGGCFWHRFIMGKFDERVFRLIVDGAAEAGKSALESMEPVTIEYGETTIDEMIENRMSPKLNYPDTLKVMRFIDLKGNITAHMVFMAAHPTMFPAKDQMSFSADFPGSLTKHLEEQYPDSSAVFVNGAAADLRPPKKGDDKLLAMTNYGLEIAKRIQQIKFEKADLSGRWEAILEERKLPKVKARAGWFSFPSLLGNRVFPTRAHFQTLRMGSLILSAFPGELASELGRELERSHRAYGLTPLVAGYANDYIGYVISRRHYDLKDEYESEVSFYGREMDGFVLRLFDDLAVKTLEKAELDRVNRPGLRKDDQGLAVLKLYGTSYHRGFEEGRLMKDEIRSGVDGIFRYFRDELKVPLAGRLIINTIGSRAWKQMSPYISYHEYEQLRGIAAGSGISLKKIERLHAMPELFPALCSNGAYWNRATQNGNLIAIRNLDWNREMGVQKFAAVKYHADHGGLAYVNIGYGGFAGVLSGINEEGISVGQIGASSSDETMKGVPMPYLLKRILEESHDLHDAKAVFERSELTRGYNYVIADAEEKKAFVAEATKSKLEFFEANDPKEAGVSYALRVEDAVFRGDPALSPAIRELQTASGGEPDRSGIEPPVGGAYEVRYLKHGKLVLENYGRLTPQKAGEIAREVAPKSNIQSVVYAFPEFLAANAEGDKRAVDSTYHRFDFRVLENWRE